MLLFLLSISCSKPQQEPEEQFAYLGNLFEIHQKQQSTTDLHSQPSHDVASNKTSFLLGHSSGNEFYISNSSFSYYYQDVDTLFIPHSRKSQPQIETVTEYNTDENGFVKECHQINRENYVPKMTIKNKRKNVDQQETNDGRLTKILKPQNTGSNLIGINSQTAVPALTSGCNPIFHPITLYFYSKIMYLF
jgi:hypothetical protein